MIFFRIKDIREDADLTQKDMCKILKTSQANYSRWENKRELIPLKKLNMLCNYFKVNMDYVIGITKNKNAKENYHLKKRIIGNNLKELRLKKKITQEELAKILNTSQSTISAYESGKTTLLTAFALQIVEKYKVSLDWLCGRKKKNINIKPLYML